MVESKIAQALYRHIAFSSLAGLPYETSRNDRKLGMHIHIS